MQADPRGRIVSGLFYGIAAYAWWGLVPLYFKAVAEVPPVELVMQRVFWTATMLMGILTLWNRWHLVGRALRTPGTFRLLLLSTGLIAINWFTFLYGVITERVLQTSLGYFITPLLSAGLGILVFQERLRPWQWLALGMAIAGVTVLIVGSGSLPWIALTLACSFGLYGMVRKRAGVDGFTGLTIETLLLLPLAMVYLTYRASTTGMVFAQQRLSLDLLLIFSGPVTAVPLICFAQAVVRVRLTTIGFLQYLSPTMAFFLAVLAFDEVFTTFHALSFGLIWVGIVLFLVDTARSSSLPQREDASAPPIEEDTLVPQVEAC